MNIVPIRMPPPAVGAALPPVQFRPLATSDLDDVCHCLCAGFGDAGRPLAIPSQRIELRLRQEGYLPEGSFGAFAEGAMVGFWLSAVRTIGGNSLGFGSAMAVLHGWRKRGIAQRLADETFVRMANIGVTRYSLQVSSDNFAALCLYRNNEFKMRRTLLSYKASFPSLPQVRDSRPARAVPLDEALRVGRGLLDYAPSWTAAAESLRAVREHIVSAVVRGAKGDLACGVFQPETGQILQIGTRAMGTTDERAALQGLVALFLNDTPRGMGIEFFQIPKGPSRIHRLARSLGFQQTNELYEMAMQL
jgi:ribosomal protein S18 acetylase RimI-like enzyme